MRAASYGRLELLPGRPRARAALPSAAWRVALGEQHRALRVRRQRAQQRRVEVGGDLRQLVGGGARRETSSAASMISTYAGSNRDRATRSLGARPPRGGSPPQRHRPVPGPGAAVPGRAAAPGPTGSPRGTPPRPARTRRGAGAARPAGRRRRRPPAGRAVEEPLTRAPRRLASRLGHAPCSCMISARWTRHCPLNGTRSGWDVAPVGQRRRPLLRPAQIEDLLACLDHAAVDEPGDDLGHLVGRDGDHDLVEQRHARGRSLPCAISARPWPIAGERHQVDVTEAHRRSRRPGRRSRSAVAAVALEDARWSATGYEQVAPAPHSRARPSSSSRRARASQPPARANSPPFSRPKTSQNAQRAARSTVAPVQQRVMGTLPRRDALVVPADQIRRHREPLDVLGIERCAPIRGRQLREGLRPRTPAEALAAARASLAVIRHEGILRLPSHRDRAVTPGCRRNTGGR